MTGDRFAIPLASLTMDLRKTITAIVHPGEQRGYVAECLEGKGGFYTSPLKQMLA